MYVKFKYLPYFMILFRYDRHIGNDIWKLNLPQTPTFQLGNGDLFSIKPTLFA